MRQVSAMIIAAAAALPAAANPLADLRPLGADDRPMASGAGPRERSAVGMPPVGTVVEHAPALSAHRSSGIERGAPLSMTDNLDGLALLPALLNLQQGNPVWSDGSITARNQWRATTAATRSVGAVNDAVSGNESTKVRLRALAPHDDNFFFGFRYELLKSASPLVRLGLGPGADTPARIEHDYLLTSVDNLFTSEPIYVTSGFITARMIIGGDCAPDCITLGLPTDLIDQIFVLSAHPESFLTGEYTACYWLDTAPAGAQPDAPAIPPIGSWIRVRWDHRPDGIVELSLNYNDGTGFHPCFRAPYLTGMRFDSLGGNSSFEFTWPDAYYDNIEASGVEVMLPSPPTTLECGPNGYSDDAQWLQAGPLKDQNEVWFDALSSKANVDIVNGDKLIRQTTYFADDHYREEFTRTLPQTSAIPTQPWTLCEEVRIDGGTDGRATVRGFAPVSYIDESFVTRLAFGRYDPNASPAYSNRIFVQHNAAYDPYDDEDTETPYLPGPNGNGAVPRVGGAATIGDPNFDYYDTGVSIPENEARVWCIEVGADDAMTVTYAGTDLVGGSSGVTLDAFVHSLNELRHESENQAAGVGDHVFVDDILLDCMSLCSVALPPLALAHLDNLQWADPGVTIGAHDDDCDPNSPFRWESAPQMPVVDLGSKTYVLQMENLHRDTAQSPGNFALFEQASTRLPHVTASPMRGYAAGADFKFTDGATTRALFVGETGIFEGQYRTNTGVLYSAGTATLWALHPDAIDPIANEPVWIDTGVSLGDLGIAFNQWFRLTIHRNLDGSFIFKVNARVLRDSNGAVVRTLPLQSAQGGLHEDLDRLFFLSGDDDSAPAGSILYADNIRAWALPCLGDTNDDGVVVFSDINNVLGAFNQTVAPGTPPNSSPDNNGDGLADDAIVNFADLNAALSQFNNPCD